MDRQEVDTLLLEAETSWQQLFNIDNRRGRYFLAFAATFFLTGLVATSLLAFTSVVTPLIAVAITVVLLGHAFFGYYLKGVYESERAANVRYRTKINLIRELLLSKSPDPEIQMYLTKKELGIKTYSGSGNEIDKLGGTLKQMYALIFVLQVADVTLGLIFWAHLYY
jgi:hypothetical protein